jgi:hypothetical protein
LRIGHVHDQRVIQWPALGRIDARHRRVVVGTRGQAVDGLGGQPDEFASGQRARRAGQRLGVARVEDRHAGRQAWAGAGAA